jgi:aryl-alcohol dehydrogenase-like predicted oxidoreductase
MKRNLGRSGIEVSAMGMGCWAIGGPWIGHWSGNERIQAGWGEVDDSESIRAIHRALDLGINFFDTAANYGAGHSEKILGQALAGRRDRVVIATKFGFVVDEQARLVTGNQDVVIASVRQDCENSLRRLNTDYIDLYQLHDGNYNAEWAVELRGILEELVSAGKIRAYGWSTDLPDHARIFAEGEHCTAVQHGLNLIEDQPDSLAVCEEFNLASVNKNPLFRGILTGKFKADSGSRIPENDIRHGWDFTQGRGAARLQQVEAVREILTEGGRTLAQGALGWVWARSPLTIPIPGIRTEKQAEENAGAMQFGPLTERQMDAIAAALAPIKLPAA